MSGVPYTFGTATTSIPLSNLDSNFVTPVTIGNASVALGNTITAIGNLTLNNVTINSGTSNISANITLGNTTISLGTTATTIGNLTLTNPTIIGGTSNVTSTSISNGTSNVAVLSSNSNVTSYVNGVLQSTLSSSGLSLTGSLNSINTFGMKNRIINGGMVIDQRNSGASVTIGAGSPYVLDRWQAQASVSSKFSVQQSSTAPVGFNYSTLITSLSSYSVLSGDYFSYGQPIEGYNVADLGFGTANAKTITLSFWVQSSLTGTFGGSLRNSGNSRAYPFSYSILLANTWTQISVTIAGDTTGTWLKTNGNGLYVSFGLGYGSTYGGGTAGAWVAGDVESVTGATSVVGTSGATFYITGVQLETGSQATSFDFRNYGAELALCQRYYQQINGIASDYITIGVGVINAVNGAIRMIVPFINAMRAIPTLNLTGTNIYDGASLGTISTLGTIHATVNALSFDGSSGVTSFIVGRPALLMLNVGTTNNISLSSEL